jgi:hypothetical protein
MVLQVGADLLHDHGRQATAALGVDPGADARLEQAGHRHRATLRGDRQPGPGLPQAIPSRQHRRGKRPEPDSAVGFHLDSTTDGGTIKIATITGECTPECLRDPVGRWITATLLTIEHRGSSPFAAAPGSA